MLHDLALDQLFSTIHLSFGSLEKNYDEVGYEFDCEHNAVMAGEILSHIIRDPSFALNVKILHIYAFAKTRATFEETCLCAAIQLLHNLRGLHWYGIRPEPTLTIFESLSTANPALERLTIPLRLVYRASFCQLPRLKSITLSNDVRPTGEHIEKSNVKDAYHALMEATRDSLTELSIVGGLVWDSPIHTLRDVTHLHLELPVPLSNIDLLFRHSAGLQSLTLICGVVEDTGLWTVLMEHASALPGLTSFKLHISPNTTVTESMATVLFDFLQQKKSLRRLDIAAGAGWTHRETTPVLERISKLQSLEVLGVDLQYHSLGWRHLEDLLRLIPHGITALRIKATATDVLFGGYVSVLDLWGKRPNIRFTYVDDRDIPPWLTMQELAEESCSLELVGHNGRFADVEHEENEPSLCYWSRSKVEFRTVEDFGCEDWEWLMRCHRLCYDSPDIQEDFPELP